MLNDALQNITIGSRRYTLENEGTKKFQDKNKVQTSLSTGQNLKSEKCLDKGFLLKHIHLQGVHHFGQIDFQDISRTFPGLRKNIQDLTEIEKLPFKT